MIKEIAIASMHDVPALAELLDDLFSQEHEFLPDLAKQTAGLEKIISNATIGEILVMKVDNRIVGMVSLLYSISTALGGRVATLEDMIIHKNYRRKGFGRELFLEAIDFSKRRNCLRLTLLTDHHNEVAIKLYQRSGFKKSGMIPMRLVSD